MFKTNEKQNNFIGTVINIAVLSLITTLISLCFSSIPISFKNVVNLLTDPLVIVLNFIPIFVMMTAVYLLLNSTSISYLITSILVLIMSIANYFKMVFREEPLLFNDITLIKESKDMVGKYNIKPDIEMIIAVVLVLVISYLLHKYAKNKIKDIRFRFVALVSIFAVSLFLLKPLYFSEDIYASVGSDLVENQYSEVANYRAHGSVYPFIYSIQTSIQKVPDDYNEGNIEEFLSKYEYAEIPEDKKVNVVAVMLESFADFSVNEEIEFERDPYENFHRIADESIKGNLLVNVFGGGTINTEFSFLNGFYHHPNYSVKTNSYPQYFKANGYNTEGYHPIYGWFYNRQNIYPNLGIDNFNYAENYFEGREHDGQKDYYFFDSIIEGFEENKKTDDPLFSFSVTYQNHGPYVETSIPANVFAKWDDSYDELGYNIFNNYIAGIYDTDIAIDKLVNYFDNEEEPVVLIMFGDHRPWLGDGDLAYNMFGMNIEKDNIDGIRNYYETPFIIRANDSAKETLGKDFSADWGHLSANFLMNRLFNYVGFEGDQYNQFLTNEMKNFDVTTEFLRKSDGIFKIDWTDEDREQFEMLSEVEYYWSNNFKYD